MTAAGAPYPSTTLANGWRFELHTERMRRSDTWALAGSIPMARAALLMLWSVAWDEAPCGSLPDDEEVIRAKCEIPQKQWAAMRAVLMRGWARADDGRLYHETITERVLEMISKRRSGADRKAASRVKTRDAAEAAQDAAAPPGDGDVSPPHVTRDITATPDGLHRESDTDHLPPTSRTNTGVGDACATPAQVCIALKAAGIGKVNPANQLLRMLLDAGAEIAEFVAFAPKALSMQTPDPFAYVLGAVRGDRERAKAGAAALHRGPMPASGSGPPGLRRQSATDRQIATLAALTGRDRQDANPVPADRSNVIDVVARSVS